MTKETPIRDTNNKTLPASNGITPDSANRIALTKINAPIYGVKFLEEIRDEFKKLNTNIEKVYEALQEMIDSRNS